MKILFDYRMIDWSGIGRYSFNLIKEYNNLLLDNKLFLLCNNDKEEKNGKFSKIRCKSKIFSFREQLELPILNLNEKIELFHSPHFVFPIFNNKRLVLTIHDLTPLLFSEYFSKLERIYMSSLIWLAKFKADKVIVVSENTKYDLVNKFGFKEEKIKVIYNGVRTDSKFITNQKLLNEIRQNYNTGNKYMLYVGNIKPHKNIPRLLRALAKVNEDIKLVIVGKRDKAYDEVFEVIEEYQLEDNVIFTGFVPDNDLIMLYNAAEIFVYPSLYEGFGLPPLEAMACGTPVITSNVSSLPEVVGDAAITVDPYNIDELASAINNILSNSDLQGELSKKGLERAKQFSWKKTAEETLKVYEEILAK
jgi:glycosyltransferase involved in cell wall biosynthesis